MVDASVHKTRVLRSIVLPVVAGSVPLALAIIAGVLSGSEGATGGLNGFVEGLAGRSSSLLGSVGFLIPLGFAFVAGMVSTVNPCGFAMLPAYLGLYLASDERGKGVASPAHRLGRALLVGGVVTAGFVLLFGVTGLVIGAGAQSVVDIFPWIGLSIGIVLAIAGAWLLRGGTLYTGLAERVAARVGNPSQVGVRGYFLFGVSYGTASLSCTLPIFLAVVGSTLAVGGFLAATGQFVVYALGMGLVIMFLTLGMALFRGAIVGALRKGLPYVQPVSAAFMILAGSYIVFYWLTIGGLSDSL